MSVPPELIERISETQLIPASKKHNTIAKNGERNVLNDRKQIATIGNLFLNGFYEDDGICHENTLFISRLSIVDLII